MNRGEIWWVDLPAPAGSEPGFRRPVLIVQADSFNRSKIRTVLCAVITSNTRLADMPGNVLLDRSDSKLPKQSVINVSQVITLDRSVFVEHAGAISVPLLDEVRAGLKLVLEGLIDMW